MPFTNDYRTQNESDKGLIPRILNRALSQCCRGDYHLNYDMEFRTQDQVIQFIKNYSLSFVMPIQKDQKSNKFLHNPFVSISMFGLFTLFPVGKKKNSLLFRRFGPLGYINLH